MSQAPAAFEAEMKAAIQDAIRRQMLSPAKAWGFEAGAEFILSALAEQGFEATVGQRVRTLVAKLSDATSAASLAEERLDLATAGAKELSDLMTPHQKGIVAMTVSLLNAYTSKLGKDPSVAQQIAKSVSYTQWAELTGTQSLPDAGVQP